LYEAPENAPEEYKKFIDCVNAVIKDYCDAVLEGNKSAGTRARRSLMDIKKLTTEMRALVLAARK